MKKYRLWVLLPAICLTVSGCSSLISRNKGEKTAKSESKKNTGIKKLNDILTDKEIVEELIEDYNLEEEDDNVYVGTDPDVKLKVDKKGNLVKLEILSEGLTFYKVEVGDVFNIDELDEKMDDFKAAEEFSLEKGAVYYSKDLDEDWYVYLQSKKSDEVERITIGLASEEEIDKLEKKVGLAKKTTERSESEVEETTLFETQPTETMPSETPSMVETQPMTVIQYVTVPTQPPQTVYVQVPVYHDDYDDTYLIPDSASRYLSDQEVNGMSEEFARYALNEIYARHGRLFNDTNLQIYFDSKSWYYGSIAPSNFKESWLNAIEKENVRKLDKRRNGKFLP